MKHRLNDLNSKQREAVLHFKGPLLILAGAGSGKTRTMAYRIAHLIAERHYDPRSILGLSFTNKAARELKERVHGLLKRANAPAGSTKGLTITTFHSLGVRILREFGEALGFTRDFTIMDRSEQMEIVRQSLRRIHVDDRKFDPEFILFQIGQTKNKLLTGEEAEAALLALKDPFKTVSDYGAVAASIFPRYQDELKKLNAMDFDDLLFHTVLLLRDHPEIRSTLNHRYQQILVDEYQDTNPTQFEILKLLTEAHQNLCVVGDDDQSIYSWRGADPTHILGFEKSYREAKRITLDQNYRSTQTILEAANSVIQKNTKRFDKRLWSDKGTGLELQLLLHEDERDEADRIAEEILARARTIREGIEHKLRPWQDFAVLFRSNAQARLIEEAFRNRRIPYRVVGTYSFLDRKEVKDLLAYWRVILSPKDDVAVRRILNWPGRGIGKSTFEKLHHESIGDQIGMLEAIDRIKDEAMPRIRTALVRFRAQLDDLRHKLLELPHTTETVQMWAHEVLEVFEFKRGFAADCDDPIQAERREESVRQLCDQWIRTYKSEEIPHRSLREFIQNLMLDATEEEDEASSQRDEVTLLTLHAAKGLEFPIVFLIGMEDGILPHRKVIEESGSIEEERRLCYVGITRGQQEVILSRSKNRNRYGKKVPSLASRFLEEIPEKLLRTQDFSSSPDLSDPKAVEQHETRVRSFLDEMRARIQKTP